MEQRIVRLEAHVEHIQSDVTDLRSDMKDVRDRMARLEERVATLPTKGFIVTALLVSLAVITGLLGYQSQIAAVLGAS